MKLSKKDKKRRAKHHFSIPDLWGFDYSNAVAQVKALKDLKKMLHGHPVYGGVETMDDWKTKLDQMIDGWQAVLDHEDYESLSPQDYQENWKACEQRFNEGMKVYVEFYWSLWD